MPFSYSELSGIWKCAIDLCLLWSETGFFPRISLHRLKTTKNPVSLVSAVVTDARVARNRVFSENIVTPPKNYEKPGFFGFCRSHGRAGGQKPGFFGESFVTVGDLAKNPVS